MIGCYYMRDGFPNSQRESLYGLSWHGHGPRLIPAWFRGALPKVSGVPFRPEGPPLASSRIRGPRRRWVSGLLSVRGQAHICIYMFIYRERESDIYIYIYIYVYMYIYIHTHTCIEREGYMYTHMCIHIYIYMYYTYV